eukprot:1699959-Pyramimonas_sp.AAC.2
MSSRKWKRHTSCSTNGPPMPTRRWRRCGVRSQPSSRRPRRASPSQWRALTGLFSRWRSNRWVRPRRSSKHSSALRAGTRRPTSTSRRLFSMLEAQVVAARNTYDIPPAVPSDDGDTKLDEDDEKQFADATEHIRQTKESSSGTR